MRQMEEIYCKRFEERQLSPFHFPKALDSGIKYTSDEIQSAEVEGQRESSSDRGTPPFLEYVECAIHDRTKERLIADKKLILLVDLDSTVLQAKRDYTANIVCGDRMQEISKGIYVMLRPHAKEFLELVVITIASKPYAADFVELLDPDAT